MPSLPPPIAAYADRLRARLAANDPIEEMLVDEAVWAACRTKVLLADPRSLNVFDDPEWDRAHASATRSFYRALGALESRRRPPRAPRSASPSRSRTRDLPSLDSIAPGPDPTTLSPPEPTPEPRVTAPSVEPDTADDPTTLSPPDHSPSEPPSAPFSELPTAPASPSTATTPPSPNAGAHPPKRSSTSAPSPSKGPDLLSTPLHLPPSFRKALLAPRTRPPDDSIHPFTASPTPRASPPS